MAITNRESFCIDEKPISYSEYCDAFQKTNNFLNLIKSNAFLNALKTLIFNLILTKKTKEHFNFLEIIRSEQKYNLSTFFEYKGNTGFFI